MFYRMPLPGSSAFSAIPGLPTGSALAGTELIPMWQSGASKSTTPSAILTYALGQANNWTAKQTVTVATGLGQIRLAYSGSFYVDIGCSSAGVLTLAPNTPYQWLNYDGINALKRNYFGYSNGYTGVQVGDGTKAVFLNCNPSTNTDGSFGGTEIVVASGQTLLYPNNANTGWRHLLSTDSSDNVRVGNQGAVNNYAMYLSSAGNVGVGTGSTVSARLHAIKTTEQLRLGYDATYYVSHTVASSGAYSIGVNGTTCLAIGTTGRTTITHSAGSGSFAGLTLNGPTTSYNGLTVSNTGGTAMFGVMDSTGTGTWGGSSLPYATFVASYSNTALQFVTNSNVYATLSATGNFGIGSNAPVAPLDMGGSSSGRMIAWAGTTGAAWYASIGTAYSSGALSCLSFLKCDTTSDAYLRSWTGTIGAAGIRVNSGGGGNIKFFTSPATAVAAGDSYDYTTAVRLQIDANGNIVPGTAALATNATDGFLYLPSCAGTPTGVPTAFTGRVAFVYDSTNDKLYVYRGGWKASSALT